MAKMKLTTINPLVADGDPYQTTVNCQAVLRFMSLAIHENGLSEEQELGRYLMLETVRAALDDVARALQPGATRSLEVVNG